ncbi:MAG: biliverdin-producing heme oxygenase [Deltaproteobacteria bacterium]|jgi:heme oxygenase|nr:biliverdin-producing heme oxygenase [Deltaproteobacteria bacterium]
MKHPDLLMQQLKSATSALHRNLEALPFFSALAERTLPKISIVGQLRVFAIQFSVLESALAETRLIGLSNLKNVVTQKKHQLLADLDGLGELLPDLRPTVQASLTCAASMRSKTLEQPASLVGYLYVLGGTALGNLTHAHDAAYAIGLPIGENLQFYNTKRSEVAEQWHFFSSQVNRLEFSDKQCQESIDAAKELFHFLHQIHATLYPFAKRDLYFCATTINPEAGNHPVPNNLDEIEAAIRAGARCCNEFPYFNLRYQARGKRFTDSDAAWLATLYDLEDNAALAQVTWLARVLAARGMPSITLIRQLKLLYEELAATVPEKQKRYETLIKIAKNLESEQTRAVAQTTRRALIKNFEQMAPETELANFPDAGELFLSAALDEHLGRTNAITSLEAWLANPQKFSATWIAAVKNLVAETQQAIAEKSKKN